MSRADSLSALNGMNHAENSATSRLTLLLVLAVAQAGCIDSIDVFPNDASTPEPRDAGVDGADAEAPQDAAVLTDTAAPVEAGPLPEDASAPFDAGTCTLRPSGYPISTCKRGYQTCAISGLAITEATFVGCSDQAGVRGNPALTVRTCAEALSGESGQTCSSDILQCTGPSADTCCVRHAECGAGGPLTLAEVCVPDCERTPLLAGPTVTNCEGVAAVDAEPETQYGSQSALPNVVGLPCTGQFECGPESSYGFSVFCGAGRLQILTLGPNGFGNIIAP